jgi:hypothetical protein
MWLRSARNSATPVPTTTQATSRGRLKIIGAGPLVEERRRNGPLRDMDDDVYDYFIYRNLYVNINIVYI